MCNLLPQIGESLSSKSFVPKPIETLRKNDLNIIHNLLFNPNAYCHMLIHIMLVKYAEQLTFQHHRLLLQFQHCFHSTPSKYRFVEPARAAPHPQLCGVRSELFRLCPRTTTYHNQLKPQISSPDPSSLQLPHLVRS